MPTTPTTPADRPLDTLIAAAMDGRPQRRSVWAFLRNEAASPVHHAEPILVTVEIRSDLTWHPLSGHKLGERVQRGEELDLEVLRGPRPWWGGWPRTFAESRLRVELARQPGSAQEPKRSLDRDVDRILAGLTSRERELAERLGSGGADGDRQLRVLATFAPPRGYGDA
jgi:hypothetical protein